MAAQRGEGDGVVTRPGETGAEAPADVRERARAIPEAAVARLAVYLRVLSGMVEQGVTTISSEELAGAAGVNSAKLRKDLSYIGSYGTRGVGYDVEVLVSHIERILGLAPITHPPGSDTCALRNRPSSGPNMQIDPRIFRINS